MGSSIWYSVGFWLAVSSATDLTLSTEKAWKNAAIRGSSYSVLEKIYSQAFNKNGWKCY
jgi:hypothetical protein